MSFRRAILNRVAGLLRDGIPPHPAVTRSKPVWTGPLCLLASIAIFSLSVLSLDLSKSPFYDLDPVPDATEYMAGAVSLFKRGDFRIHVAGEFHPPRYPPGYSLLMVPVLWMGASPVQAPFVVNRVVGLATLLLLFAGVAFLRSPAAAGISVLLIASFPMFIILCRSPMSEISSGFLCLLSFLLFWAGLEKDCLPCLAIGSFVLGLSVAFRISNLLLFAFVPLVVALLWASSRRGRGSVFIGVAFGAGLAPLLVYQWQSFGSPLMTGYSYWVPGLDAPGGAFGLQHLLPNLKYLAGELLQQDPPGTPAWIFGQGSYLDLTFPLLLAVSLMAWRQGSALIILCIPLAINFVLLSIYAFSDGRFWWSGCLLLTPAISCGFYDRLVQTRSRGKRISFFLLSLLLGAQILGYPNRWASPELVKYLRDGIATGHPKYDLCRRLETLRGGDRMVIFTNLEMPYVYALVPGVDSVFPLDENHSYRFSPEVLTTRSADLNLWLRERVLGGDEVWAVVGEGKLGGLEDALRLPSGFYWKRQWQDGRGNGLARAEPDPSSGVQGR